MNDYAESIEKIEEFRPAKRTDPLMPAELKLYRGYTGKISWLADNVCPDLVTLPWKWQRKEQMQQWLICEKSTI